MAVRILDEWKSSVMSGQDSYTGCFALAETLVDYGSSMDDAEVRTAIGKGLDNLIADCEKGYRSRGYDLADYCIKDGPIAQFVRSDRVWIDRIIDILQKMTKKDMRLCYKLCEIFGKGSIIETNLEESDCWWDKYEAYYTSEYRSDNDPYLEYHREERADWRFS